MKKNNCFRIGFAVFTLLGAVLQCLAVLLSYHANSNYFDRGSLLPILAIIFALLGAVCGTVSAILTKSTELRNEPFSKGFSLSPMVIGFVAVAAIFIRLDFQISTVITAALLLLAAIYAVLASIPKLRKTALPIFTGFFAIAALVALNAHYYFDMTVEMNAPLKITTQIALLCIMISITGELRYLLNKQMPRTFLAVSAWVVSIGALSAIATPLAYLTGKTDRLDFAVGGVLILCGVLTSIFRMLILFRAPTPIEEPTTINL